MRLSNLLQFSTSVACSMAAKLYVSSYDGNITSINVIIPKDHTPAGQFDLKAYPIAVNNGCAPSPSWLQLHSNILFCGEEGNPTPNSSIFASFQTTFDGSLGLLSKVTTPNGNVNSAIFGNGSAIALAEYGGSAISTVNITNSSALSILQTQKFNLASPGPKPQQSVSRPHQIIFDPTEMFMLSPDLGADFVRVFHVDPTNNHFAEQSPIKVAPGSGPRHAIFYQSESCGVKKTYLYLVTEISNMLLGYEVTYNNNMTLSFNKIYESGTFGFFPTPVIAAASEIILTANNQHLIISSRNDTFFQNSTNPDSKNSTRIASDTLITYIVNPCSGALTLTQLFPAGGSFPRSMELNRKGDLLAVALQLSSRVVIFRRDHRSGLIKEIAASVEVAGQLTDVVWDECEDET